MLQGLELDADIKNLARGKTLSIKENYGHSHQHRPEA
jgi:hypothetical protein